MVVVAVVMVVVVIVVEEERPDISDRYIWFPHPLGNILETM